MGDTRRRSTAFGSFRAAFPKDRFPEAQERRGPAPNFRDSWSVNPRAPDASRSAHVLRALRFSLFLFHVHGRFSFMFMGRLSPGFLGWPTSCSPRPAGPYFGFAGDRLATQWD